MNATYLIQGTPAAERARALLQLGKPRVVLMLAFTSLVGMVLASPGLPPWHAVVFGTLGIALLASSAAAVNCLAERRIDAAMVRTRFRPLPTEAVGPGAAIAYIAATGFAGLAVLGLFVNALTMVLTFATFMGYGLVYTLLLKPLTPQNIVIGGASGAMPPLLGWVAVTGTLAPEPLLIFLIVFMWTPPHFWALALHRRTDYSAAGIPMLPVTHGPALTRRFIFLYTVGLAAATLLPFAIGSSGLIYLAAALVLDAMFVHRAWRLMRDRGDSKALALFRFSITYLGLLFAALVADHWFPIGP